ncbi:hypothetical protein EV175_005648 [Coemansia sp. RSA 1933]|nr:hypothetical protein EV175_005648 [Coemansia sp. RSA 1933]
MFGSIHNQNKENAVLGSVARTGKTGLLGSVARTDKTGLLGSKAAVTFGTPMHPNTMTPGKKGMVDGKQATAVRPGLRDTGVQTPSMKPQVSVVQKQDKTIKKRRHGLLFTTNTMDTRASARHHGADVLELLEPEYAPPSTNPGSLPLCALDEFGCDLDVALVPMTQLSTSTVRARKLPPLDLDLEAMVEIPLPFTSQPAKSQIPRPGTLVFAQFQCKPVHLVAHSLYPSRIPHLKRKR